MICASLILGLHLVSYHTNPQPYQRNFNPGAYVECDGWTVGAYRNTLGRASVYAGHTWRSGPFALTLGAVTGYEARVAASGQDVCRVGYVSEDADPCLLSYGYGTRKLVPMVVPSVKLGFARLSVVPRTRAAKSTVIHLSIEREL